MRPYSRRPATIGAALTFLIGSCTETEVPESEVPEVEGVSVRGLALLASTCAIEGETLTVKVKDGESAYVTRRKSDGWVTVNGKMAGTAAAGSGAVAGRSGSAGRGGSGAAGNAAGPGQPCALAPDGVLKIVSEEGGSNQGRSVVLDYINGAFLQTSGGTPAISIDFPAGGDDGAKNSLKVRGSNAAESFALGARGSGASLTGSLNINALYTPSTGAGGAGGSGAVTTPPTLPGTPPSSNAGAGGFSGAGGARSTVPTFDGRADITFKGIGQVVISAGGGNDRIVASPDAGAGVGNAFPYSVSFFGNEGDDTVIGGLGDDTLSGGLGADTLSGCEGNDTYDMGSTSGGADTIAQNCTEDEEGDDTLDFSRRYGNLIVNLGNATATTGAGTSGEQGEGARISDNFATIKLGAGNDTLTIANASRVHHIFGGPGDDTFNGSAAPDVFDGQGGDDTCIGVGTIMDYSSRNGALNVSICGTACTDADANDGESTATSTRSGFGAVTAAGGGISVASLTGTGFTPASVGNKISFSGCDVTTNNTPSGRTYTIVSVASATEVTLDATGIALKAGQCQFSEARSNSSPNVGNATLADSSTTVGATITGLSGARGFLGRTIRLSNATLVSAGGAGGVRAVVGGAGGGVSAAPSGGAGGTVSRGVIGEYRIVKVISDTAVAIDSFVPVNGGAGGFSGGVTNLAWTVTGPEHDNVQCASVTGGKGNDTIWGDARDNVVYGGGGNDTLNGGGGSDTLYGEAGDDRLFGGAGDDTLMGGEGADKLTGGDQNDVLEGDEGADELVCDGSNASTDQAPGNAPGEFDIRVDVEGADKASGEESDCEH